MLNDPSQLADILAGMRPKDVTPQLIVEVAVGCTLQQGYACERNGAPKYYNKEDRCAIGWLLPERYYTEAKEGKNIDFLSRKLVRLIPWYRLPRYFYRHALLLRILQAWHDDVFIGTKEGRRTGLRWLSGMFRRNGYDNIDLTFAEEIVSKDRLEHSAQKAEISGRVEEEKELSPA